MTKHVVLFVIATLCAILFATAAQAAEYIVTDLGVAGAENTLGWGINSRGQVTGYAGSPEDDNISGFVWNPANANGANGTLHTFGTLGGDFSWGIGINAIGQVSGLSAITGDAAEHATLWNPTTLNGSTGTLHDLGTLGGTYSQGTGINNSGQLTGYSDLAGDVESRAIMWKPTTPGSASGTMNNLGSLGGSHSFGWDINASGLVTGDSDTTANVASHAMLWRPTTPNGTNGSMYDLGTLGGTESDGSGINDDGLVAGSSQTTNDEAFHAFLWTPALPGGVTGTMQDLGTLGGSDSYGYNINAAGQVVGSSYVPPEVSNYTHAFLYRPNGGMVDLNSLIDPLSGIELHNASEINDLGQITGQGFINNEYHAYLLTPVSLTQGDFNRDGSVDAADYVVWRKTDGTQTGYATWRTNFGQSFSSTGAGSAATGSAHPPSVPEPSALVLALLAAAVLCAIRDIRTNSSRWPKNY